MVSPAPTVLAGLASAFPEVFDQTDLWEGCFSQSFAAVRGARRAYFTAGVDRRHAVANPCIEDLSQLSTAARMQRYAAEAPTLAKEAVATALDRAGLVSEELGLLVVVSCTGYVTPGIDVAIARDLALSPSAERVLLGHMGCHGALPAVRIASDFVASSGKPALVCCVELSSLHRRPVADLEQVVVHALFSDGAAAVCVLPADRTPDGCSRLLDVANRSDLAASEQMTWEITDQGFAMHLSREVPATVGRAVDPLVDELLSRNGLGRRDVSTWAVHPGGPRILDVVGERLGLSTADLESSRATLAAHGNCSSATLLIVLEELGRLRPLGPGEHGVALTFGPGMTCCAALLQGV